MSFEQRSTILPISSEAEALRQAVLLSMRPNRRETTQNENQEGMTTIQQTDVTLQEESTHAIQSDRYTTPPPRRSEECFNTPEAKILNTSAVLARQASFSPEEGEYVDSNSDDDFQGFIPRTNPFNVMQAVANGTNYERTAGNLLQRYFEESPRMALVFNGAVVGRPPMEVNFDDNSDAEDNDVGTYIRRRHRVPTPCPRSEDLTPSNYILDYVESLEASQNNSNEDKMQVDSEEQVNENTESNNYVTSDRKGNASPIPPNTILNSPVNGPGTADEINGVSSNNNCVSEISGEVSSINQMCEVPSNTTHTPGGVFNKSGDDPPNTAHTNGDQIACGTNQINENFTHSTVDVQMAGGVNDGFALVHTIDDVQNGDFNQMSDNFSPVLAHSNNNSPACSESDNAHRLPDGIVNMTERSAQINDISAHQIGSPAEDGEIEEGEIVESEITFEEHVIIKSADEETRELMKELYEEYGAQPFDIIEEGIPIDVVVRFTRELNHRLPPELEVFSVVTPSEQVPRVNPVSPSTEPVIKLEPVEDNLPIINDDFDQHESSLPSTMATSFKAGQNFVSVDRPFMTPREQNFIIDLSDSSDGEHRIAGLLQEVKSSLSSNETQIDAKRKLEEKEREIKRMNELIASKTELLKRKSSTPQQVSSLTNPNTGTSIDMIRAALDSFETAKSQVSEIKSRLNEEEKRLENIRSEMADIDNKIGTNSSLAKQYSEQIKNFDVQKDQMLQKKEEIELRIRAELVNVQSQIDNIDKEKEIATIELAKKEEEYAQHLKAKEQHLEQKKLVSENVTQIRKQLGPLLKDIKAKKEQLSLMVGQSTKSTKARNESTMAESSAPVLNKNGKRRNTTEPEIVQEETPKKPKLALEVAELSRKIERVSKEQQSLRESLEKKRQGDTETTIIRKGQNSCSENEWRAEKIASQETISENKFEVFRPYESPLKGFRSFRLHPEYVEVVKDIKSFTFSNHIVPNKKICAFELQPRGICNDDDCRSQHFRDLPMTEKETIDDLAGYYEGENFSQQRLYREGLHRLLGDLEMSGGSTFSEKFEEIKKYRDTFVANNQNDGTGAPRVVFINEHQPLVDDWYISPPVCESESDYVSESLPTPRMPTSLSSGQDDDQQQIYPTSPELEDEDEDGDYFSPSPAPRHMEDENGNEKYESYSEEVEMGNESDDQFAELSESESDSTTSNEGEEENVKQQDTVAYTNRGEAEEQERQRERHDQQEGEQAYAPFGYVGRFINWFL